MSEQRHIIKRQLIELQTASQQSASQIQAEMSRIYRQRIIPLIDQICSELSDPNRIYRLDLVQLDLGVIDIHTLEVDIVSKVRTQLRQQLAAEIKRQENTTDQQEQSQLELLTVFARTGSLPWWADTSQPDILTTCLQQLLKTTPDALRQLIRALAQEKEPVRRLILAYSDMALTNLLTLLIPADLSHPQEMIQLLLSPQTQAVKTMSQIRQNAWLALFSVAISTQPDWTNVRFYTAVSQQIALTSNMTTPQFLASLYQRTQEGSDQKADLNAFVQMLYPQVHDMSSPSGSDMTTEQWNGTDADQTGDNQSADPSAPAPSVEDAFARLQQAITNEQAGVSTLNTPDDLYVANAGLVILWPFLTHFFTNLNLLQAKAFKHDVLQQRAVGILQYLVTEESVFPEYLLPLNKLLCGVALTAVIDPQDPFSTAETEECTHLLQATISQAPILRNMSVEGFRGTFLQRQGILRARDGAWLLQVEQETYDVVLERFPWGWEWVKLPWMDTALRVEWV